MYCILCILLTMEGGERMNRLTVWNGKKYVLPQGRTSEGLSNWRIIAERLAAYENTDLDPEEIEELKKRMPDTSKDR